MSALEAISIPIQLKTITPVSVGNDKGAQLSAYTDYVFSNDGNSLIYLDVDKLVIAVRLHSAMDDFIKGIRSSMNNNRSEFDLGVFIENRLNDTVESFMKREVLQKGLRPGQRVPITQIVKNGNDPYLPGSSIKGALRTPLLYHWLLSQDGNPFLQSYADSVSKFRQLRDTWMKMKKGGGKVDFREVKSLEAEIKKQNRAIFNEDDLFGTLRDGPEARHLRVRDSSCLTADNDLEIQALKRIRLVAGLGKSTIPQIMEAIPAGKTLISEISIVPDFRRDGLRFMNSASYDGFFSIINTFSMACIENEVLELGQALSANEKPDHFKEIEKLLSFYLSLKEKIENGAVFLRLGFGKTVNDNSLLLAFLNGLRRKAAWHDLRAAFHKMFRETGMYPVTRLITPGAEPMGWVEIVKG